MSCEVINSFFDMISTVTEKQRMPKDYGTGHLIYHSEVILLLVILNNPQYKATDIAKSLEITKGAVTQNINKLIEKGFVEMIFKVGNKKEKYYRLTELGKEVINGYREYHEAANAKMCEYFSSLDEKSSALIFDFFDKVKEYMPFCEHTCDCNCKNSIRRK